MRTESVHPATVPLKQAIVLKPSRAQPRLYGTTASIVGCKQEETTSNKLP
jgi:hypothetical protein